MNLFGRGSGTREFAASKGNRGVQERVSDRLSIESVRRSRALALYGFILKSLRWFIRVVFFLFSRVSGADAC